MPKRRNGRGRRRGRSQVGGGIFGSPGAEYCEVGDVGFGFVLMTKQADGLPLWEGGVVAPRAVIDKAQYFFDEVTRTLIWLGSFRACRGAVDLEV